MRGRAGWRLLRPGLGWTVMAPGMSLRCLAVVALVSTVLLGGGGCLTFSSFQSARVLEPGRKRLNLSISRNDLPRSIEGGHEEEEGESPRKDGWLILDVQQRRGLERSSGELGLRFALARSDAGAA